MGNPIRENLTDLDALPTASGVARKLRRLVDDEAASLERLIETVGSDPVLSARLIKLINSPFAGATRTIASVSAAAQFLGSCAVRDLAQRFVLVPEDRAGVSKSFDYERFWSESLARAIAARGLASHLGGIAPDEIYTLALVSKLGGLALATVFPHEYDALLKEAGDGDAIALLEAQRHFFEVDQNAVTAQMLADWHMAEVFCEAARLQDVIGRTDEHADPRVARIAGLLQLAGAAVPMLAEAHAGHGGMAGLVTHAARVGIKPDVFTAEFEAIETHWGDARAVLADTPGKSSASLIEATPMAHARKKLLIVERDTMEVARLGRLLGETDFEILTASNGAEALRILFAQGCQMVISTFDMPEMNGLELCRAIRESEGAGFVYFVLLASPSDSNVLTEAFDAGVDDYLSRPLKPQELLARLKAGTRALVLEDDLATQHLTLHKANAELAILNQKFQELATTDELTGLHNRREAIGRLKEHWSTAQRHDLPLACIMIDIDHFKQCNDTYGHNVGDVVLRAVARVLKKTARAGEAVFRIGGEEFLVVCPGATAKEAAEGAERMRFAVESNRIDVGDTELTVTISVGVAERTPHTIHSDDLLKAADEALYQAKHFGRNLVCVAPKMPELVPIVPASPGGDGSTAESRPGLDEEAGPRGCVLVVDDDPSSRTLFRMLLEKHRFDVHEAGDGLKALEMLATAHPDVILMDVLMPSMDGLECTRRIKANPDYRDVPIIMVSGHDGQDHVMAGLQAGAEEYIAKPVQRQEFVLRVQAMTNLHRSKAELKQSNQVRGEQARVMGLLFDLSRSLAAAPNVAEVVERSVAATVELTGCRRVSIMLPDPHRRYLYVAGAMGLSDELIATIRVPIGQAIAGRVFATGESTVLESTEGSVDLNGRYDSNLFASVPLASHTLAISDRVVGVLNVTERQSHRPFEARELEYLDLVCNMTATSLEQLQGRLAREHAHASIVTGLAKLAEYRDADTGEHLERVTRYAVMLADALRKDERFAKLIDDRFIDQLRQAMPLHDIGKVAIPDAILLKPGKLTPEEFEVMKKHPEVGAKAIEAVILKAPEAGFLKMAKQVAYAHHEWVDGSGYPRGLSGDAIPLAARIAAVADVYDALTTERPYKGAFSHEKSVEIITGSSGTHFDPDVVKVFLQLEREFAGVAAQLVDPVHRWIDRDEPGVVLANVREATV
ncbi:MAG: diguanylate cyclase [Phycisphaerae bacterium]